MYVPVVAKIVGKTPYAVRVRVDGEVAWLPMSTLEDHGKEAVATYAARDVLSRVSPEIELQVAKWKAEEMGWC